MRIAVFILCLMLAVSVHAGTIQQNGSVIVIGPDANWKPGDACTAPHRPLSSDPAAISDYQAQRQKFMDCARTEADGDKQTMQQDLDRSLADIQNDQLDALDEVHQENRGAVDRLGLGGYRM